jgi:enediyne biosynthesis protein E4
VICRTLALADRIGVSFAVIAVWTLTVLAGCNSRPATPPPATTAASVPVVLPSEPSRYEDVTDASGVTFIYRNGEEGDECTILESLGGGLGLFDYDGDGRLDLFFPGGGKIGPLPAIAGFPPGLFRNGGEMAFADVSAAAGLTAPTPHYSHGCAIGDYDNDGFPDIAVTGFGGVQVWHNRGDGTFAEVGRQSGIVSDSWTSSGGWGDLNGDGNLDLYLAHYVNWSPANHPHCLGTVVGQREICPPRQFVGLSDRLFLSSGDGTFRDGSQEAGLVPEGKGLGVLLADIDLDGDLDIYVANDTTDNFLYVNDGHGRLEEVGVVRGVARDDLGVANGSMGVDVCDFNRDGLPDLWAANYERESFALYRNEGQGHFLHVSQATGITALGGMYVGFGTVFSDHDADGDEDVLVANGHVIKYPRSAPLKQEALLLLCDKGRFRKAASSPGDFFAQPHMGRGLAVGDLDGDLRPDAVFSMTGEPARLLRNNVRNDNRHLWLKLIGTQSNRDAVGAVVVVNTSEGPLLRQVKGGGSYLSHSDLALHVGIPAGCDLLGASVRWPSGERQEIPRERLSGRVTLVEPPPAGIK